MLQTARILIITSAFLIPISVCANPSAEYTELVDQYTVAKRDFAVAETAHKQKLAELRRHIQRVKEHPEYNDHLYGPDERELSSFEDAPKNQNPSLTEGPAMPQNKPNWPLRTVFAIVGGGAALAVGSYWIPEGNAPIKRTMPPTDELYEVVKRKYRILDEEDEY